MGTVAELTEDLLQPSCGKLVSEELLQVPYAQGGGRIGPMRKTSVQKTTGDVSTGQSFEDRVKNNKR